MSVSQDSALMLYNSGALFDTSFSQELIPATQQDSSLLQLFAINIQVKQVSTTHVHQPSIASISDLTSSLNAWFDQHSTKSQDTINSCTSMVDFMAEVIEKSIVVLLQIVTEVKKRALWRGGFQSFLAWKTEIDYDGRIGSLYRQCKHLTQRQKSLYTNISRKAHVQPQEMFDGYVPLPKYLSENWLKALSSAMERLNDDDDLAAFKTMARDIYSKRRAKDTKDTRSTDNLTRLRIKDLIQLKERWEESLMPLNLDPATPNPEQFISNIADEAQGQRRPQSESTADQSRPREKQKRKRLEPVTTRTRVLNDGGTSLAFPAERELDNLVQTPVTHRELQLKEECQLDGWIIDEGQTAGPAAKLLFTRPSLLLSRIDRNDASGREVFSELLDKFMELIVAASAASDEFPVPEVE